MGINQKQDAELTRYADAMQWALIDYDGIWGSQCVDLIKNYTKEVLWVRLGTFGGSARSGWLNTANTFLSESWKKHINDTANPNQVPFPGDIIFFDRGEYGHVAIVLDAKKWENRIEILEQNVGNGDGQWDDDATKKSVVSYSDVYGWYEYIWNTKSVQSEYGKLERIELFDSYEQDGKIKEIIEVAIKRYDKKIRGL